MAENPFFLVWCEGGGAPTFRHQYFSDAKNEAARLARINPGKRFTVMVAVQGVETSDLRTVDYLGFDRSLDDEIPF